MIEMLNDTLRIPRQIKRRFGFSAPYWEGTRARKLLVQFCPESGQYQHFPRPVSIATGKTDLEWREVDGRGEIYSYSVERLGPGPFRGQEPYMLVIVRLDIGVDIMSNLIECAVEDVHIGLRVRPHWLPLEDGTHLLLFAPDGDEPAQSGAQNA